MALVAQIATLESRIPFIHFFDGFRTSHEVAKSFPISDETIRAMVDDKFIIDFRKNALSSDRPLHSRLGAESGRVLPGRARPARPTTTPSRALCSKSWTALPSSLAAPITCLTTTAPPNAERVMVIMGSGAEVAERSRRCHEPAGRKGRSAQRSVSIGRSTPAPSSRPCLRP